MASKNRSQVAKASAPTPNPRKRHRKRRRARRNPWDSQEALTTGVGAGVGSLVGGIAGAVVGMVAAMRNTVSGDLSVDTVPSATGSVFALPALTWLGSIAGGALGGRIGASDRRKGRGTAGGAIGGIFGPIGAAVGGAAAGGYHSKSRNPTPLGWAAIALGGAAALGSAAWAVGEMRKSTRLTPGTPSGGDTTEPTQPGVVVPKIYLGAKFDGSGIVFSSPTGAPASFDMQGKIADVNPASYPVDVVLSVPANFNPIGTVESTGSAEIVAGTPGVTRDVIVRVSQPGASIFFHVEYWPPGGEFDGYTNELQVRLE